MSNKQEWEQVGNVYSPKPKKKSLWDTVTDYMTLAFILMLIVGALKSCS